ncbi:MAG: arylsulfatase [Planctomycetaceae bacterium]
MSRLCAFPLCCLGFLLVSFGDGLLRASEQAPPRADCPNIVFILADDLGYRELGCYGQTKIRTPHLDQLAAEGLRLTQHYSGNAVCAPSRCVLMTGRDPGHAWIRNNSEMQPEGQKPIPASEVTIAELLKARGYVTGAFGKWGLGGPGSEGDPLNQGFDRFFGYNCQRHAHSFYPDYLWSNTERIALKNNPPVPGHAKLKAGADPTDPRSYDEFKGQEYAPDRIREAAMEFITEHKERPFFLYYPTTLPHVALHVPDEELKPYLEQGWNDPPFAAAGGGYTPHFTPRAAYAAMISHMDRDVGALLKHLKELDLEENTLVVFSSDNGTTHLDQEVDHKFFGSVGNLRGLKGSLYEGGVRVPTIIRWPGHVAAGTSSDFVSGFEDWLPTLLEITGGKDMIPEVVNGISLHALLTTGSQSEREYLYREFPGYGGQQSLRVGRWKAVRQNLEKGQVKTELYDIDGDVSEAQNVAGQNPSIVEALELQMNEHRTSSILFPLRPFDAKARRGIKKE